MTLILDLNPADWAASTAELHARSAEGYALPVQSFVLAERAHELDLVEELTTLISGLVAIGTESHWLLHRMLVTQTGATDDDPPRPILELAVTLKATADHPEDRVRGMARADTWSSESLPSEGRDAMAALWSAITG